MQSTELLKRDILCNVTLRYAHTKSTIQHRNKSGRIGLQWMFGVMDGLHGHSMSLLWTHAQRSVHVIFCRCFFHLFLMFFFIFFMAALVGQTAERIFTKLSHVVDIRHYLRTY